MFYLELTHLFTMQEKLDQRIKTDHNLTEESLFERKILALLVELGELANETRCFKFWSKKPSSTNEVILEEYVDGLHFILSLGIEMNVHNESLHIGSPVLDGNLVSYFITIYSNVQDFAETPSLSKYQQLVSNYFALGHFLHFSFEEIERAYLDKNTINHNRQDTGY